MDSTKSLLNKLKAERIGKSYNLVSLPSVALTEEEADRFIDYMVDESVLKGFARIERMNRPQKNIRAIGFGSGSFLYPADEFDETVYKKTFADNKIQLSTKKVRGAITIYDDDLEDLPESITEDAYKNQLIKIITAKIMNELEEAYWIGETHAVNGFAATDIRGLWDGWRWRITHSQSTETYYNAVTGGAHVLDASGAESASPFVLPGMIAEQNTVAPYNWEFKYGKALKAMPAKYKVRNGLANMSFLNSDLVTQDYIEALSARSTTLGDAAILGTAELKYGRVKIVDAPLMAADLDGAGVIGGGGFTDVLLTPVGNLIVGIQRDIKIESKRDAAIEGTHIFYSLRTDLAVENPDAVVLVKNMTHLC